MELTPLCWILFLFCTGLTIGDASINVIPNRSQFFKSESVSMSCGYQGISTGWTMRMKPSTGNQMSCSDLVKYCTINPLMVSDSGEYWCESGSGVQSTAVNITVHDGHVILESPALPVTEGSPVTLRCRYIEHINTKKPFPCMTAGFYKHGSLIYNGTTGNMTISTISGSDEGIWKCKCGTHGESPESLMTVTAANLPSSSTLSSTTSSSITSPSSPLLIILSVSGFAGLFISLIILLLLFCNRKKTKEEVTSEPREVTSEPREEMYADVRIKQEQEHRRRRDKSSRVDPVYSAVKTSPNTGGASAGSRDVTYGQIDIRTKKKKKEKLLPPEPDVVYSSVRPASGPSKGGRVV